MSGLPQGEFLDYLIIGLVVTVAAGLIVEVVKRRLKSHFRRILFAVALVVVCVIARFWFIQRATVRMFPPPPPTPTPYPPPPTPTPSPPGKKSPRFQAHPAQPEDALDVFVRKHIAGPSRTDSARGQWAVLIADPEGQQNYPKLTEAASVVLGETGQSMTSIFRPSASRGAGFKELFAADPALARRLHNYCDQILLGKVSASVSNNPISPGLLTLTLAADLKIVSTSTGGVQHQFEISAAGAGYSPGEAKSNAEEALASNLQSELRKTLK